LKRPQKVGEKTIVFLQGCYLVFPEEERKAKSSMDYSVTKRRSRLLILLHNMLSNKNYFFLILMRETTKTLIKEICS
jgi:hypothetical protein